jgi:hypothetical protein
MSDPIDVKLILRGGAKSDIIVNGVDLAKVVGLVELHAPPGEPPTLTLHIVPDTIEVQCPAPDVVWHQDDVNGPGVPVSLDVEDLVRRLRTKWGRDD